MSKLALLIFVFFSSPQIKSFFWDSKYTLKYADFQGGIPDSNEFTAISALTVVDNYSLDSNTLNYSIRAQFNCSFSWIKVDDSDVLRHEQGHFNIAEIHARRLRKYIHHISFQDYQNDSIEIYYSRFVNDEDDINYDNSTDRGSNLIKQKDWDCKIRDTLESLKAYENPENTIILKNR